MTQVNTLDRTDGAVVTDITLAAPPPAPGPGVAPGGPRDPRLWLMAPDPPINLVETFRALRNRLLVLDNGHSKVFALTGAERRVGTSAVAFNLGLSFGLEMFNENTILIDANVRRPVLHTAFNVPKSPGLIDHLLGRATLAQVVRPSGIPRLSLIGIGDITSEAGAFFSPAALTRCLDDLREQFAFIIIDTAPVLLSGQTDIIAAQADGTILVVEACRTRAEVVRAAQDQLRSSDARLVGGFLNKRRFVIPEWLYRYV
jgi:capsular exopolysaccharide synthesis family protein